MPEWLGDWKTIAGAAAAVVLAVVGVLDAVFKNFSLTRRAWAVARAVGRYLRDLFSAPRRIRAIERRMALGNVSEPVREMGVVWFPSDVSEAAVPHCQHCWADKRRIELVVWLDGPDYHLRCGSNRHHYQTPGSAADYTITKAAFEHTVTHAFDLRRRRETELK